MSGLKELKSRIRTVDSTMKITSAMKMVSVSRLRKSHALLQDAYPYADEMNRVFRRLVRNISSLKQTDQKISFPLLLKGRPDPKTHLLVCVTSDEGLCGQFNETVLKRFEDVLAVLRSEDTKQKINVLCFGYRGGEVLRKKHPELSVHILSRTFDRKVSLFNEAQKLSLRLTDMFYAGRFDICTVIYSAFMSAIEQKTKVEQLVPLEMFLHENKWDFLMSNEDPVYVKRDVLGQKKIKTPALKVLGALGGKHMQSPLEKMDTDELLKTSTRTADVYDYYPQGLSLLEEVLPYYVESYFYKILLETAASENAFRMMSMENASKSAAEKKSALAKQYHRKRQELVTKELVEITAATGV